MILSFDTIKSSEMSLDYSAQLINIRRFYIPPLKQQCTQVAGRQKDMGKCAGFSRIALFEKQFQNARGNNVNTQGGLLNSPTEICIFLPGLDDCEEVIGKRISTIGKASFAELRFPQFQRKMSIAGFVPVALQIIASKIRLYQSQKM